MRKTILLFLLFSPLFLAGCSYSQITQNLPGTIKKTIGKSVSLECKYTDDKSNPQTAYIKDEIMRVNGVQTMTGLGNIIYKEKMLWMWTPDSTDGILFDLTNGFVSEKKVNFNPENLLKDIEYQRQNCNASVLEDSLFVPPADISFLDLEQFLDKLNQ